MEKCDQRGAVRRLWMVGLKRVLAAAVGMGAPVWQEERQDRDVPGDRLNDLGIPFVGISKIKSYKADMGRFSAVVAPLVLLLVSACAVAGQVSSNQTSSLLLLGAAIDRNGVLDNSWKVGTDPCTWEGISCNAAGQVTTIDLQGKQLSGQLPLDEKLWSNLDTLQNLNLAQNDITGFLPPQMSAASGLEYISVRDNGLESPLPVTWGDLKSLKGVDLSGNKLFGDLPPQWSGMSNLQTIDLSNNTFTGPIPTTWSNLTNLDAASLAGNQGLCQSNPNSQVQVQVYYGPCDTSSPVLPNINPTYPPAPPPAPSPIAAPPPVPVPSPVVIPSPIVVPSPMPPPSPVPIPSPEPTPSPEPAPSPEIVPSPSPEIVPSPSPEIVPSPSPEIVPSPSPEIVPSPSPAARPSNYVNFNFEAVNKTLEEFYTVESKYISIIAQSADVPDSWVELVSVDPKSATSGRRLLAQSDVLQLNNKIYSNNTAQTESNLVQAVDDGSLGQMLQEEIGMLLVPSSVDISQPSSTNVGAIVGGVVGGVVGLALIGGVVWYVMKKRRGSGELSSMKIEKGPEVDRPMYTQANAAFESEAEPAALKESTKEAMKVHESAAYEENPLDTPKGSSVGVERDQRSLARSQSDLSDIDQQVYTPSTASGALTSRSKLDSARSGLQSNRLYDASAVSDGDEDGQNPMFVKSARSGTSDLASADSGLDIDSSRYGTTSDGRTTGRSDRNFTNVAFNDEDEEGEGNNALFQKSKK